MTAWLAIFLTTATTSTVAGLATGRAPVRLRRSGPGEVTAMVTAALALWVPALFTADPAGRHAAAVALPVAALTDACGVAAAGHGHRPGRITVHRVPDHLSV